MFNAYQASMILGRDVKPSELREDVQWELARHFADMDARIKALETQETK